MKNNEEIIKKIKTNIDDLFKIEPQEPYKMSQKEFVEKTKAVLNKICNTYSRGWQSRVLIDGEHPEESVCDKCAGCGTFMDNGEEKECIQDRVEGECFHRFCDYEQVGMDLETHIEDILDLLSVDEIVNTEQDVSIVAVNPKEKSDLHNIAGQGEQLVCIGKCDHKYKDEEGNELFCSIKLNKIKNKDTTKCNCTEEEKTGETSVMCCNRCGMPVDDRWTKKVEIK